MAIFESKRKLADDVSDSFTLSPFSAWASVQCAGEWTLYYSMADSSYSSLALFPQLKGKRKVSAPGTPLFRRAVSGSARNLPQAAAPPSNAGNVSSANSIIIDDSLMDDADDNDDDDDEPEETIVDRLRLARNDAMQQHLYSTAAFWGSKAYEMTSDANDAFWLAQIHFLTHQPARAERILTTPKPDPSMNKRDTGKGKAPALDMTLPVPPLAGTKRRRDTATAYTNGTRLTAEHMTKQASSSSSSSSSAYRNSDEPKLVRLTDISIACRYLVWTL
jgi:hypothetical protein